VIKFVSDLRQVSGFSVGTPVSSTNKTDRHDIQNVVEILLKLALNTINPKPNPITLTQSYSRNSIKKLIYNNATY